MNEEEFIVELLDKVKFMKSCINMRPNRKGIKE